MDKEFLEQVMGSEDPVSAILQAHQRVVADYESRIRTMAVDNAMDAAVRAAGGHNAKAIRALVDESAFADCQDLNAAAAQAVAAVKKDSPYLFRLPQVYAPGTGAATPRGDYTMEELGKLSLADYRRYRKGM